jgi:sulfate adenylyltransferase subunit 2
LPTNAASAIARSAVTRAHFPIKSNARTVPEIIEELRATNVPERAGRAQDKESEDAFEKLRRDGYM